MSKGTLRKKGSWGEATQGIRSAQSRTDQREHSPAIFATSSFVYDSADQAAAECAEQEPG